MCEKILLGESLRQAPCVESAAGLLPRTPRARRGHWYELEKLVWAVLEALALLL